MTGIENLYPCNLYLCVAIFVWFKTIIANLEVHKSLPPVPFPFILIASIAVQCQFDLIL